MVCDHLGLGVKSGKPYIWHSKASNPFNNLRKEYKGIFWQEEIVPFFQQAKLSEGATDAASAYLELAEQVRAKLGQVDEYFVKLADGMVTWIECWRAMNE